MLVLESSHYIIIFIVIILAYIFSPEWPLFKPCMRVCLMFTVSVFSVIYGIVYKDIVIDKRYFPNYSNSIPIQQFCNYSICILFGGSINVFAHDEKTSQFVKYIYTKLCKHDLFWSGLNKVISVPLATGDTPLCVWSFKAVSHW